MTVLGANISALSTGENSLIDPADALRNAMVLSAVLEYAPEPVSEEEATELVLLKVRQRRQKGTVILLFLNRENLLECILNSLRVAGRNRRCLGQILPRLQGLLYHNCRCAC